MLRPGVSDPWLKLLRPHIPGEATRGVFALKRGSQAIHLRSVYSTIFTGVICLRLSPACFEASRELNEFVIVKGV